MATATIDLPDGTKVVIEGDAEEVARIFRLIRGAGAVSSEPEPAHQGARIGRSRIATGPRATGGVMQYVRELIDSEYFAERRSLSDVQRRLEDLGRIYPLTHLSTPLRRLVQSRELRRLRQGRNWVYVADA